MQIRRLAVKGLSYFLSRIAAAEDPISRPQYFVRVVSQFSRAVELLDRSVNTDTPSSVDLENEICSTILEPKGTDISLFGLNFCERFDAGHALGVMAATLNSIDLTPAKISKYRASLQPPQAAKPSNRPKDEFGRKVVALIFSRSLLERHGRVVHSPEGNLNFSPADSRHFDLKTEQPESLAADIIRALQNNGAMMTFLRKPDYRTQAAIALSQCIKHYGNIEQSTGKTWKDGRDLPASDQVLRLRACAGDFGFQSMPASTQSSLG